MTPMRPTTRTPRITPVDKHRSLEIDLNAFTLDAVKRAAYRFTDKFSFELRVDGQRAICNFYFEGLHSEELIDHALACFRKELLDQDLRATIQEETKDVRNLVLAHAFSRTGLIDDDSVPKP